MLPLNPQSRIFVAVEPVDFRRGIDGLGAICRQQFGHNPLHGAVFVFRNRRATAVKLLAYDGQGFVLCLKRLSTSRFQWWPRADTPVCPLSARELQILLWNGHPGGARLAEDWRQVA